MRPIIFIFITILFVGCKVQKLQTEKNNTDTAISKAETALQTYSAKISGTFKSIPFKGTLRMKTDSVIWVSITGLGFEAARILMRQDSVFVLNKLEKEVFIGDYTIFEQHFGLPINFSMAQKVLTDTLENNFNFSKQTSLQFIPQGTTTIDRFIFPKQLTAKVKKNNMSQEITVKFTDHQINIPIQTPFSIPSDYDTIKTAF